MGTSDSKPLLLIVEDNDSNFLLLKVLLRKQFNIHRAQTGSEAFDKIKNYRYALVLMDIKLPDIDGIEATKRIKALDTDIPIIAQSAYAFPEIHDKAIEAGCSYFITKPINKDLLYEAVNKYMRK